MSVGVIDLEVLWEISLAFRIHDYTSKVHCGRIGFLAGEIART